MNRETIIQMAREAGLAEVTDTNQNLRQAEQALLKRYAELVNSGDAGNWYQEAELEVIAARQALALPTAEQVDDINVAESFTSVTKTAAPVGEQEVFERTMMDKFGWQQEDFMLDNFGYFDGYTDTAWIRRKPEQPRAALSAGDAVDEPQSTPIACAVHVAGRTFEKGVPFCDVIDYIESNTTRWVASSDRYPPEGERVVFMNRETIIQMARESGLVHRVHLGSEAARELSIRKMQAFAALVAAKEREDCAKVCAALEHGTLAAQEGAANDLENVMLRQVASLGHAQCAAAIRARGEA